MEECSTEPHEVGNLEVNQPSFTELTIQRVKKKRQLTEKQQENWKKALETRKKNVELRKQAKQKMKEMEEELLENDPEYLSREKSLKDLLLTLLSSNNTVKIQCPLEPRRGKPIKQQPQQNVMSKGPPKEIQRIQIKQQQITEDNPNGFEDETNEKNLDETDEYCKYKPKTIKSKQTFNKQNKYDEDDEGDVNIFKD